MKFSGSKLITPPAIEPVTLDEAKAHMRLETTMMKDDDLITALISAARQQVEESTQRALIEQTWDVSFDASEIYGNFGSDSSGLGWWDGVKEGAISVNLRREFYLPRAPLVSVTSLKYFSESNVETVFPSTDYLVDVMHEPGRLVLNPGAAAPTPTRVANAIIIRYVAGYGPAAADVPFPLRTAIKQLTAHWYENREPTASDQNIVAGSIPMSIQFILDRYRIKKL